MDKYELQLPCHVCRYGKMIFVKSKIYLKQNRDIYRDIWRCDNCGWVEWQDKTDFIFDLERAEESPLNESIRKLIQAKDEMLAAIKVITDEYKNNGKI